MDLKLLSAIGAAGAAGGDTIGVEDVFKTYLWKGTGNSTTITNDIDLSGEGGLTWIKNRSINSDHMLYDTERGATKFLNSNDAGDESTEAGGITAFNSNGFTVGDNSESNQANAAMCSWTVKKQEKFFDIVTWSKSGSNGTAPRVLNHNLGSTPGFIMLKQIDSSSEGWICWHRAFGYSNNANYIRLNQNHSMGTDGSSPPNASVNSADSTTFTVGKDNDRIGSYIAYLFAHEEAEFGPNSDQSIISCGSYTGTGSTGLSVTLPFEPQYLLIKNTTDTGSSWMIFDAMRGVSSHGPDAALYAQASWSEYGDDDNLKFTSTGFKLTVGINLHLNENNSTFIYIAIAAETGKTMKKITDPTKVFAIDTGNASTTIPSMDSGFPVDFALLKSVDAVNSWAACARLIKERFVKPDNTNSIDTSTGYPFDSNVGWGAADWLSSSVQSWMWKRHAGFDLLVYESTGNSPLVLNHNLGPDNIPEMIWTKNLDSGYGWAVYHSFLNGGTNPENYRLKLETDDMEEDNDLYWNDTAPTASQVTLSNGSRVNQNATDSYLALLFSSVNGISKCGGYDGDTNVEDKTISCGFAPRFVIGKIRNLTGGYHHWFVFDSTRGAGSGNDKTLRLDVDEAQTTNQDIIEFTSDGFIVKAGYQLNEGSRSYIYYAHA